MTLHIKHQLMQDIEKILIILGFFSKFGKNKRLLEISNLVDALAVRKQINFNEIEKIRY